MIPIKNIFKPRESTIQKENKNRLVGTTDYSRWLLYRIFALAFVLIIGLIPLVMYFMASFEGREITVGEAAIFIMQTITTTGYGELLPFQSIPMKILALFLMAMGVFLIFMIAGTLMATLIESRIIPKAPTMTQESNHVVFTCYNKSVERTIKLLNHHDIPYVVAADEQPEAVELLRNGINCICANPRHNKGIKNLNIENARLVVVNNDDTININIILGIFTITETPILAVMENKVRAELAYAGGAKLVIALEETLGEQLVDWICANATPTEFLKLIEVDVSSQILEQLNPSIIHVGAYDEVNQKTIGETRLRSVTGATIAAIWNENGTITTPSAETRIEESTLIALGPHKTVDNLASFMGGPRPEGQVILVGAGRVGQEAGKRLNYAGIYPDVIDISERTLNFQGNLIVGDATKPHILKKAKVEEADTLIATLDNDSLNIFTILASKQLNSQIDVVARAIHTDAVDRLHQAGANHVLSEAILGFQLLQMAMVELKVLPKVSNYLIQEMTWNKETISIQELADMFGDNVKILCIVRDNKVFEPTADLYLQKNDKIVILGIYDNVKRLVNYGAES